MVISGFDVPLRSIGMPQAGGRFSGFGIYGRMIQIGPVLKLLIR
jgi:hypothetical protein